MCTGVGARDESRGLTAVFVNGDQNDDAAPRFMERIWQIRSGARMPATSLESRANTAMPSSKYHSQQ